VLDDRSQALSAQPDGRRRDALRRRCSGSTACPWVGRRTRG